MVRLMNTVEKVRSLTLELCVYSQRALWIQQVIKSIVEHRNSAGVYKIHTYLEDIHETLRYGMRYLFFSSTGLKNRIYLS